MNNILFTASEIKILKQAKKELLTDRQATFDSNRRNNAKIQAIAEKYNVNTQTVWNLIK